MPDTGEIALRLLAAAFLGSAIGLERERLLWAAGLRTHMLVCVGSALIMLVSAFGFGDALKNPDVVLDPSRVAAQVVSGIGFLGAGTILLRHDVIRGLTTAASLWTVAAIGLAVGGGLYLPAVIATVLILGILMGLKPLENRLFSQSRQRRTLVVEIDPARISRAAVVASIARETVHVKETQTLAIAGEAHQALQFLIMARSDAELGRVVEALRGLDGVVNASLNLF